MADTGDKVGADEDPRQPRPGILLWLTLIVSLAGTAAFVTGAIMTFLSAANSTFGALGGALMVTFAAPIAAIIQFRAVARRQQPAAWLAGAIYWLLAGLSLWALVSNAIEAVVKKSPGDAFFWGAFGSVCVALALVFAFLARLYGRWSKTLESYERHFKRCPRCQYDLRGSLQVGSKVCPECGYVIPESLRARAL